MVRSSESGHRAMEIGNLSTGSDNKLYPGADEQDCEMAFSVVAAKQTIEFQTWQMPSNLGQ
jgi:hypothetical protein